MTTPCANFFPEMEFNGAGAIEITTQGDGSCEAPLIVNSDLLLSADGGNALEERADGLYAAPEILCHQASFKFDQNLVVSNFSDCKSWEIVRAGSTVDFLEPYLHKPATGSGVQVRIYEPSGGIVSTLTIGAGSTTGTWSTSTWAAGISNRRIAAVVTSVGSNFAGCGLTIPIQVCEPFSAATSPGDFYNNLDPSQLCSIIAANCNATVSQISPGVYRHTANDGTITDIETGESILIGTNSLINGSVITSKIASSAVTTAKIEDGAVTDAKLASDAVSTLKIVNGAITTSKIATSSVTIDKIVDGAVTNSKLGNASVTTNKIADQNISNAKLANSSVTGTKIANGAITEVKLQAGSVTNSKLGDGAVNTSKLANNISISVINGSDSAPSVRYGNSTTGMFSPGLGQIGFSSAGALMFTISNVGIYAAGMRGSTTATSSPSVHRFGSAGNELLYQSSSAALKQNITPVQDGTALLLSLNPVRFDVLDDDLTLQGRAKELGVPVEEARVEGFTDRLLGFLAEEVHAVDPSFATSAGDGVPTSVSDRSVVAALVAGFQELHAEVKALKARVAELETDL